MQSKANHIRWLLCAFFVLAVICTVARAGVIYVDADASNTNDGSSWANAYWCLQNALAEAQQGDEIRVANGIYRPDHRAETTGRFGSLITASGDRTATFQLINGVTICGAYAGYGEPDPNARDIDLYETVLSGDLADNDVDITPPPGSGARIRRG